MFYQMAICLHSVCFLLIFYEIIFSVQKYHYVLWFWVGQCHLEGCGCGGRGCMDFLQSEATTSTPPSSAQLQQSFEICSALGCRLPRSISISIHLMKIVEAHTKSFEVPCSRIKTQGSSHLHGLRAIVTTAGGRRGGLWLVFDGRKSRDKTEQQFEEEPEPALPETRLNLGQPW